MFNCFSAMLFNPTKLSLNSKHPHYKDICARLSHHEIGVLGLIFEDLSTRISEKKLTFQNFLNFFNLTGLWGAKLFHHFDQNHLELISFEQFLYGISQTAKAPYQEKIRLLYRFFEDQTGEGIDFRNFTKMILLRAQHPKARQPHPPKPTKFDQAYSSLLATTTTISSTPSSPSSSWPQFPPELPELPELAAPDQDLPYKITYSNMNSLIQQFAVSVYSENGIDVRVNPNGRLSYQAFEKWIKANGELFRSYYSVFHINVWGDGMLDSCKGGQAQFLGRLEDAGGKTRVYGFQVSDIIVCCDSKKNIRKPIKIICLQGLNIQEVGDLGIEISHCSDCYKNSCLWFDSEQQHRQWLQHLKMYQRDSLHKNYITGQAIGCGKFSIVYKCRQKKTNKVVALKKIQLEKLTPLARKSIINESKIMKIINHHQVVKYIQTLHTKTHQYIITQFIFGEDLFQYVRKRQFLNQFQSAFLIGNVIKAVLFLHQIGIIHRDLKPQNIMVIFKPIQQNQVFQCTSPSIRQGQRIENIKIIDFGLANHISEIQKMDLPQKAAGTPNYIAPQILLQGNVSQKSDAFSIGSILYFLLRGRLPFASVNHQKTLMNTIKGDYDLESQHWDHVSEEAKDLIRLLLEVDPEERIGLEDAVNHPWFGMIFNRTKLQSSTKCLKQIQQNKHNTETSKFCLERVDLDEQEKSRKNSGQNHHKIETTVS